MPGKVVRRLLLAGVLLAGVVYITATAVHVREDPIGFFAPLLPTSEKKERVRVLVAGMNGDDRLTDVLIYAVFDTEDYSVRVLQIPRDTYIGDEYVSGKINAVYKTGTDHATGMSELKKVVRDTFGLETDYCAAVNMEGFRSIVDAMGGIKVDIPQRIEYLPEMVLEPGLQTLDGEKAEWFVRYRAGYATADLGRLEAQKIFLYAAFDQVREQSLGQLVELAKLGYQNVYTDISLKKLLTLAGDALNIERDHIQFFTVPGEAATHNGYSIYNADEEGTMDILNLHFAAGKHRISPEDLDIPYGEPDPTVPEADPEDERLPVDSSQAMGGTALDIYQEERFSRSGSRKQDEPARFRVYTDNSGLEAQQP